MHDPNFPFILIKKFKEFSGQEALPTAAGPGESC